MHKRRVHKEEKQGSYISFVVKNHGLTWIKKLNFIIRLSISYKEMLKLRWVFDPKNLNCPPKIINNKAIFVNLNI